MRMCRTAPQSSAVNGKSRRRKARMIYIILHSNFWIFLPYENRTLLKSTQQERSPRAPEADKPLKKDSSSLVNTLIRKGKKRVTKWEETPQVVLLVITVIKWNKMGTDRKEKEKQCTTKHVTGIQKQKDSESSVSKEEPQALRLWKGTSLPIAATGKALPDNGETRKKVCLRMGGWGQS